MMLDRLVIRWKVSDDISDEELERLGELIEDVKGKLADVTRNEHLPEGVTVEVDE